MKIVQPLIILTGIILFVSCQKSLQGDLNSATYLSPEDFYKKHEAPVQSYIINGATGGTFTTAQGTKVTIPAAAFVTLANGTPVTDDIKIMFRDIYKKSDMLFSRMPTVTTFGKLLKSGGEFFINVNSNGVPLQIANGKKIEVAMPVANTGELDDGQFAFMIPDSVRVDSAQMPNNGGWMPTERGFVSSNSINYIFSLYTFSGTSDSGTWCNSDNAYFFNTSPLTKLTLNPKDDPVQYKTDVFLLFKNVAAMVHVYQSLGKYPYDYAPVGFECTMVAVGVKDGKLYSSFVPITITENQSVDFTLSETTEDDLLTQLKALD